MAVNPPQVAGKILQRYQLYTEQLETINMARSVFFVASCFGTKFKNVKCITEWSLAA
jgi:hypothetical protein